MWISHILDYFYVFIITHFKNKNYKTKALEHISANHVSSALIIYCSLSITARCSHFKDIPPTFKTPSTVLITLFQLLVS